MKTIKQILLFENTLLVSSHDNIRHLVSILNYYEIHKLHTYHTYSTEKKISFACFKLLVIVLQ